MSDRKKNCFRKQLQECVIPTSEDHDPWDEPQWYKENAHRPLTWYEEWSTGGSYDLYQINCHGDADGLSFKVFAQELYKEFDCIAVGVELPPTLSTGSLLRAKSRQVVLSNEEEEDEEHIPVVLNRKLHGVEEDDEFTMSKRKLGAVCVNPINYTLKGKQRCPTNANLVFREADSIIVLCMDRNRAEEIIKWCSPAGEAPDCCGKIPCCSQEDRSRWPYGGLKKALLAREDGGASKDDPQIGAGYSQHVDSLKRTASIDSAPKPKQEEMERRTKVAEKLQEVATELLEIGDDRLKEVSQMADGLASAVADSVPQVDGDQALYQQVAQKCVEDFSNTSKGFFDSKSSEIATLFEKVGDVSAVQADPVYIKWTHLQQEFKNLQVIINEKCLGLKTFSEAQVESMKREAQASGESLQCMKCIRDKYRHNDVWAELGPFKLRDYLLTRDSRLPPTVKDHIIYCGDLSSAPQFVKQLRFHSDGQCIKKRKDAPDVVIVCNEDLHKPEGEALWEPMSHFGRVWVIQGTGTQRRTFGDGRCPTPLEQANVMDAAVFVVPSADRNNNTEALLYDGGTIQVVRNVQELVEELRVTNKNTHAAHRQAASFSIYESNFRFLMELNSRHNIKFIRDPIPRPRMFASGQVYESIMLDTLVVQMYHSDATVSFLEHSLGYWDGVGRFPYRIYEDIPVETSGGNEKCRLLESCHLSHRKIPKQFCQKTPFEDDMDKEEEPAEDKEMQANATTLHLDTAGVSVVSAKAASKTFGDFFDWALERESLVIGLYRKKPGWHTQDTHPYSQDELYYNPDEHMNHLRPMDPPKPNLLSWVYTCPRRCDLIGPEDLAYVYIRQDTPEWEK